MRRALGLMGETPRPRHEPDQTHGLPRGGMDRMQGGMAAGLHRRRFVQDGEIPVTVVRRDQAVDRTAHRAGPPAGATPTSSRLQRVEAALAGESEARERAERALAEAQTMLRDLRTKIGHADLARHEAVEALRSEREAIVALRQEVAAAAHRIGELEAALEQAEGRAADHEADLLDERARREAAELALRAAETAREAAAADAGRGGVTQEQKPARSAQRRTPVVAGRATQPVSPVVAEPEPVKWWLNTKPSRRR